MSAADRSEEALRWVAVEGEPPAPGTMRGVDADGAPLVLCNVEGTLYAVEDRCPHVRIPLSGGCLEGPLLQCPLHGGKVDVRDGSPAAPPVRRPVPTHPVRQREGAVEIGLPVSPDEDS